MNKQATFTRFDECTKEDINAVIESYNAYAQENLANRTADKAHIQWLNIFNSSVLRRDGHIGFGDCGHYYMPGPVDWWVHFFFSALLDRSKLELPQNHSARDNE